MNFVFALVFLLSSGTTRPRWVPPEFHRLCGRWFCISYERTLSSKAKSVARMAPDVRNRVRGLLGDDLPDAEVILSSSRKQFRALLPKPKGVPNWAAAVAYPRLKLIIMGPRVLVASRRELKGLLAHEYSHLALAHAVRYHTLPSWFVEGVADLQAQRATMVGPFSFEPALPLSRLSHGFPSRTDQAQIAYDQSRDFVVFLLAMGDARDFRRLLRLVVAGMPFERAVERVYGRPIDSLRQSWRTDWRYRKIVVPLFTSGALLWILAIVLLVMGHRRRRRQLREFETMPDERDDEIEEMEDDDQAPAVAMEIPPGSFLLAAGGLALLLAALLETIWPRVRWTTLLLVAGIVVSLGLIGLWKMARNATNEETSPQEPDEDLTEGESNRLPRDPPGQAVEENQDDEP